MALRIRPVLAASLALALGATVAGSAAAQTWAGGSTTPSPNQIIAVDRTGEPNWLYGAEDLAGDGATFQQQEQSIDVRTAYAKAEGGSFYFRAYVSDTQPAGGNVSMYAFLDTDQNASTGGGANATAVNPLFTTDPSNGGYEYVIEIRGSGTAVQLWKWDAVGGAFRTVALIPTQATAEAGTDLDPIRLNALDHGYLQARVDNSMLGLDNNCSTDIFVRSANSTRTLGDGDLDVGQVSSCVPTLNANGVPTVLVPSTGCTSSAECAAGGACISGSCVFAATCVTNADCGTGMECTSGRCVVRPPANASCTTNADCANNLVCVGGSCTTCTSSPGSCGAGMACAPDGTCVSGTATGGGGGTAGTAGTGGTAGSAGAGGANSGYGAESSASLVDPAAGEKVQGGACACTLLGARRARGPAGMAPGSAEGSAVPSALGALAVAGMLAAWRRRRAP